MKISRRTYMSIAVAGLLALVYVVFFLGLFSKPQIGLVSMQGTSEIGTTSILFGLDQPYHLTLIRVERVADDGQQGEEVWSLVGSPRSEEVRAFRYGQGLMGMTVAEEGKWRKPLQPGQTYRLILKAGRARGEHVFTVGPDTQSQAQLPG